MVSQIYFQLPPNSVQVGSSPIISLGFQVDATVTTFAYLWETTPVLGTEALPIYADNKYKLPGAPWIMDIRLNDSD